jgi:hypothetical protein
MEEKSDITKIHDICTYANLAAREEDPDNAAYHQYLRAFESLLRSHIARIDDKNTAAIKEMISVIFIVYDDMLDSPDQESSQGEKLAGYIESLLANIKKDASYLQHWSMQSCIDTLLQTKELDTDPMPASSVSLEEFVESSLQELDELLLVEQQKINIQHADELINDDDDDQLSKEMEKILHLSSADMYPELPRTTQNKDNSARASTDATTLKPLEITIPEDLAPNDDNDTLSEEMDTNQHFIPLKMPTPSHSERDSETGSHTTHADEVSSENTSRPSSFSDFKDLSPTPPQPSTDDALLQPFTEKFHTLIGQFHGKTFAKNMKIQDSAAFEKTTDQIVKTLMDAYKHCFQQGLNIENVADFDKVFQSITSHWSYWSDKDLSKPNAAVMEQAVSKLNMCLLKLTHDMRQHLTEASRQAFKNPTRFPGPNGS